MAKYVKGLFKDTSPEDQPQGTWRYAKNMTMHPVDGCITIEPGITSVASILGNKYISEISNDYADEEEIISQASWRALCQVVIGTIEITDDRIILFIVYDWELAESYINQVNPQGFSDQDLILLEGLYNNGNPIINFEIGEFDGKAYRTLYQPQLANIGEGPSVEKNTVVDLNFSKHHFIEGTYKKNPEGELFVYWTDDLNPPRVMNITRQKNWLKDGVLKTGPNAGTTVSDPQHYLYGLDHQETNNLRHDEMLNLFPSSGPVPHINLQDINPGGGLLTGVYYLALAYVDQDLVQTNYVTIANPVSIVEDVEGVLPIERYDGAPAKVPSGKSISWEVHNINIDYEYIRPAVIRKSDGATQAFKLNDVPIRNLLAGPNTNTIVFTGLEGFSEFSVEDIIVDTVFYDTAKSINQLDGVLYLGNVQGTRDLGYQKYANNIKLCAETKLFCPFDPHEITQDVLENNYVSGDPLGSQDNPLTNAAFSTNPITQGYRWNENIFSFKGYTRDEVYAFYIAFIMNDGTESYAYHIPGRESLRITAARATQIPAWANDPNANTNLFLGDGSQWEAGSLIGEDNYMSQNTGYNPLLETSDGKGRIFHFYETSMLTGACNMNFWQNTNEFYPSDELNKNNWEVWDAQEEVTTNNYQGEEDANGNLITLSGRRVRHHHFPSNENPTFELFPQNVQLPNAVNQVAAGVTRWFALDFSGATGEATSPGGITTDVWQWMTEAGVTDGPSSDLNTLFGYTGNLESYIEDIWETPTGGVDSNSIICCRYTNQTEANGAVWPQVGIDQVSYAFRLANGWTSTNQRKGVGRYSTQEYVGSGQTIVAQGNWNMSCSGIGDLYVPINGGPGQHADLQRNSGGPNNNSQGCGDWDEARYWGVGCMFTGLGSLNPRRQGCGGPDSLECFNGGSDACDTQCNPVVLWSNDTGTDNLLIIGILNQTWGTIPLTSDAIMDASRCEIMVWWPRAQSILQGPLTQCVSALGFSLHDLKVPQDIAEKTQGFRIYYANREHQDRRILGQSLLHPYAPTLDVTNSACASASSLGLDAEDEALNEGIIGQGGFYAGGAINQERYWINYPYTLPSYSFESVYGGRNDRFLEYQCLSFHDFYLMRTHKTLTAATHLKVEYGVDMLMYMGPGITHECDDSASDAWSWNQDDNQQGAMAFSGMEDCFAKCLNSNSMTLGYHVGFTYYNATNIANTPVAELGDTGGQTLYQWFLNYDPGNTLGDLNRPIKERGKTYINGDSILNGKQLGFGFKNYNEFGESHIGLLLHERYGILPAFDNSGPGPTNQPVGIAHEPGVGSNMIMGGNGIQGGRRNYLYQGNLHAFRQDMYNSIDTQDLVWTGFQVVGEAYKGFIVSKKSQQTVIDGEVILEEEKFDTKSVFNWFNNNLPSDHNINKINEKIIADNPADLGKIFGGDTYICRYGYRKTLRPNLNIDSGTVLYPSASMFMGRDMRFVYETIVETTDNINFRHIESKKDSYWPGTAVKDILHLDNLVDLTDVDNIKYNDDYSSLNDIGHTVPLPLQISQPTDFPTRVVRSTQSDDSSLVDSYRVFLANQFKDLPKNRGELWKISVFNNLLYFHMEDTILRTKGKQNLQLADKSEAFVGSGDIFAQPPDELVQTDAGFGGTQSQWGTVISKFGYFYLDQKSRSIYMITDQINNISSLGMEKWFQENIPYAIEQYKADPPNDNPYTFGFIATWDEEYQRIILTKRELIPSLTFKYLWGEGNIKYDIDKKKFIWRYDDGTPWEYAEEVEYTYLDQIVNQMQENQEGVLVSVYGQRKKNRLFEPSGWSISYNPELNVWISFHDDLSYQYSYIGNNLYSWVDFTYNVLADITPSDDPITISEGLNEYNTGVATIKPFKLDGAIGDSIWLGNEIWWHHPPGYLYQPNQRFKHRYTQEIEVIHNEANDVNKLFYNFGYNVDVYRYGMPESLDISEAGDQYDTNMQPLIDTYHAVPHDELHDMGFDTFVVWNSHQNSGYRDLVYLQNIRRNGSEWNVSYFRDIFMGNNTTALAHTIWAHAGMTEYVNPNAINYIASNNRKFVDKWIAIRLICKNQQNFINLLSTKVGIRKYHRNEKK